MRYECYAAPVQFAQLTQLAVHPITKCFASDCRTNNHQASTRHEQRHQPVQTIAYVSTCSSSWACRCIHFNILQFLHHSAP